VPVAGLLGRHANKCDIAGQRGCPEPEKRRSRRRERFRLSAWLARHSTVDRVRSCGRLIAYLCDLKASEGVAHFAGLKSCASIWACPVCAAKVAARRIEEIAGTVQAHLDLGGGAVFLTLTFSHHLGMRLGDLLDQRQEAWARLRQSRTWRRLKDDYGVEFVGMREHTWGPVNGWHPHLHAVLLTSRFLTEEERQVVDAEITAEWLRQLQRVGLSGLASHAVRVDAWNDRKAEDMGGYLAKQLAMEVGGGTYKEGREGQLSTWQLLDAAADGEVGPLALWVEHEAATFGRHAMFWSAGARKLRPGPEQTDEEVAEQEVGGDLVVSFDAQVKGALWALSPRGVELLELCEQDRSAAVAYVVAHAPPGGQVFLPIPIPDG
jgi:hypothetical protein